MLNNEYMNTYMKERWATRRKAAIQQLGGKCVKCGTKQDLQFHHLCDKTFTIAAGSSFSEERFQAELAKCELLCIDCHKGKHPLTHGKVNRHCKCDKCREAYNAYTREYKRQRSK